jgi:hypothetical protein
MSQKLYVGNLPYQTDERELQGLAELGEAVSRLVRRSRPTPRATIATDVGTAEDQESNPSHTTRVCARYVPGASPWRSVSQLVQVVALSESLVAITSSYDPSDCLRCKSHTKRRFLARACLLDILQAEFMQRSDTRLIQCSITRRNPGRARRLFGCCI